MTGMILGAAAAGTAMSFAGAAMARQPAKGEGSPEGDDAVTGKAAKPLKILVLGGTAFTGPHFVRLAMARGHSVSVFNRGRTEKRIGPLPEGVTRLVGDRDPKVGEGLKALEGDEKFDVVIDMSGQIPRHVRASAEMLKDRAKNYVFVSSISAIKQPYPEGTGPDGADETVPAAEIALPDTESMGPNFENYSGFKAKCEATVAEVFGARGCSVRPGLIVGPGDPTDRFTYWPVRVSKGGEVLCPNDPGDWIQFIDVRDLAAFLVILSEEPGKATGIYHTIGPEPTCSIGRLVDVCKKESKSDAKFTFVPTEFLQEKEVTPWGDMPVWIPRDSKELGKVSFAKAKKAGLKSRSVEDTVKATLEWWPKEVARRDRVTKEMKAQAKADGKDEPKMPDPAALRAGISQEREKSVLADWHESTKSKQP